MSRFIVLWFPQWPLQRLVSKRPELAGKPLVLETINHRGHFVADCSAEAAAWGILPGIPIAEARALARRRGGASRQAGSLPHVRQAGSLPHGEGLAIEPYDPGADRAGLVKLGEWLQRFSPLVGVEQGEEANSLLMDATNLAPLYGGESVLVEQLRQALTRLGLTVHIALADSIGAAWGVAHYAHSGVASSAHLVPEGGARKAIGPLPLAALRLEAALCETLYDLGLSRVEEVLELPRDQLESRFGPQLRLRIDQALGHASEVIEAIPPPQEFAAEWLLEHPVTRLAVVEKIVRLLVRQVAHQLATRGHGALEIACRFTCPPADPVVLRAGLFRPTSDAEHLVEILEMHLERQLLPAPVTGVQLSVLRSARQSAQQQVLFEPEPSLEGSWQVAGLVDRLSGRLGADRVVRCHLQSEAQPELAWREESLVSRPAGRTKKKTGASPLPMEVTDRPLHVLEKPERLQVMAVAPDGPPVRFHTTGHEHQVARHWGPERIATGWWRKEGIHRDYYRVETTEGRRFWLFRHQRSGKWFLHGVFD